MIVCNQVMKYILDRIDKDERQAAKRRKKEEVVEAKRRLANASKLSSLLYRHKESLKMEILKKRALLDKELQLEAQVWRKGGRFITAGKWDKTLYVFSNIIQIIHFKNKEQGSHMLGRPGYLVTSFPILEYTWKMREVVQCPEKHCIFLENNFDILIFSFC